MDATSKAISNSVERLNLNNRQAKRKFTPNISKGLAKKSSTTLPHPSLRVKKSKDENESPKEKRNRGRIDRNSLQDENPKFIQSYSLFEKGVGCVVKADKDFVDMRSVASTSAHRGGVSEVLQNFDNLDPITEVKSFVTDIKQYFKSPPVSLLDQKPSTSQSESELSTNQSAKIPSKLFDETLTTGSLFSLQLPEILLSETSPAMNEGKIGKIQILDNGETRLVISEAVFLLRCPRPATCSTDVVLVDEQTDGVVNLTSIGHIDQFVAGVPDLSRFSQLGK